MAGGVASHIAADTLRHTALDIGEITLLDSKMRYILCPNPLIYPDNEPVDKKGGNAIFRLSRTRQAPTLQYESYSDHPLQ